MHKKIFSIYLKIYFVLLILTIITNCQKELSNPEPKPNPRPKVLRLSIYPDSAEIDIIDSLHFRVHVKTENKAPQEVKWDIFPSEFGTINQKGIFKPNKLGAGIVKATSLFDTTKSVTAKVYVVKFNKIAFARVGSMNDDIYIINFDGSEMRRITTHPAQDLFPTWSPDGTQIAFNSNRDRTKIYILDLVTKKLKLIENGFNYSTWPAWSPDGEKIAFTYIDSKNNTAGIAYMDTSGNNLFRLTTHACYLSCKIDGKPTWSPDGSYIAFQSSRNGNWEVYIIDINGTNLINLTNNVADDNQPSWSPDGSKIAFVSNRRSGSFEIYSINIDGSNLKRLTNLTPPPNIDPSNVGDYDPTWSPDGSKIAFARNLLYEGLQIWTINSNDGSDLRKITIGYLKRYPSWRP